MTREEFEHKHMKKIAQLDLAIKDMLNKLIQAVNEALDDLHGDAE